jgi:WD40 repeat protein
LASEASTVRDLLALEYELRREQEVGLTIAEYQRRFPQYGAELPVTLEQTAHRPPPSEQEVAVASRGETLAPDPAPNSKAGADGVTQPPSGESHTVTPTTWPIIPGYHIVGELGRGGMGVVYKAYQVQLKRLVAVKMILAGAHAGLEEQARFRREAEAVASLQHPHIVQIHEVGEQDGRPYFSLEFVDGGSLEKKLDGTPWPAHQTARLVETLARAMHAAHQRGIIHRDLKPANVLLTTEGMPKITDFGLAKRLDMEAGQTQSGAILGTPSYMAPEQAESKNKQIGPAADIYALGAILYEMLTGRPPFKAATPLDTVLQVMSEEPISLRRLQPKLPRDLETICLKCLEKEPGKRYVSALALGEDLRRFLNREPIQARPVGVPARFGRWCRRNPVVAGLGATIALLLVIATMAALVVAGQQADLRAVAQQNEASAITAKEDAERASRESQLAKAAAEKTSRDLETALFTSNINLAYREWLANNSGSPELLLDVCPAKYRGWEWHFLNRLCHPELLAIQQKEQVRIMGLALRPDGRRLATLNVAGVVRIYEVPTGKELLTFRAHSQAPVVEEDSLERLGIVFSPDGQRLAAGSEANTVRIWDALTGQLLFTHRGHTNLVLSVAWSPDGKWLASCGRDRTVRVWRPGQEGGQIILAGHGNWVNSVAFSSDSRYLASASFDGSAKVWDLATQKPRTGRGHPGGVYGVAFSPDGRRVASAGGGDRTVRLWDVTTMQEVGKLLHSPLNCPMDVAFSPDGRRLVSTGYYSSAKVWDVDTETEAFSLYGHNACVRMAAFSPDGRFLVTADSAGAIKFWNATSHPEAQVIRHPAGAIGGFALSPDGRRMAVTMLNQAEVRFWTSTSGWEDLILPQQIPFLRFSEVLRFWEAAKDRASALAVAFSLDGKWLATGDGKKVRLWDVATGKTLLTLTGHQTGIWNVVFHPNGKELASAAADGTVKIWDLQNGRPLHSLEGNSRPVRRLAFSSDGRQLASAGADGSVRIWDPTSGKALLESPGYPGGDCWDVAFSPDGRRLASVGRDNCVRLWDTSSGSNRVISGAHAYGVYAVDFSPVGRRPLATAGGDGLVKVWEAATNKQLLALRGHSEFVYAVRFSGDGPRLISVSGDGTIRIWSAEPHKPGAFQEMFARPDLAWHRAEAEAAATARQPYAVCFHLGPLIATEPKNADLYAKRGLALAELQQYDRAASDLARVVGLRPGQTEWIAVLALVRLAAGDSAGYRNLCAVLLTASAFSQNVPTEAAIFMAALAPDVARDPADLVRRAEKILQKAPHAYSTFLAYGAALYRAGEWARAADQLWKAREVHGQGGTVFDWSFLAMTHHRLGQPQEARSLLEQVRQALDRPSSDAAWDFPGISVPECLPRIAGRILFREAKGLIEPEPRRMPK